MRAFAWLDRLEAIAPALLEAAVRGAVVLLVALAVSHLLRRHSAAARHLVWVGAIVVQLALPLFAIWGPRWNVALPRSVASMLPVSLTPAPSPAPAVSERSTPVREDVVRQTTAPATLPASTPATAAASSRQVASQRADAQVVSPPPAESLPVLNGRTLLLLVWLAGALFILARLAVGTTIVAALARRGARVEDGGWLSLAQRLSSSLQIDRPLTLLRGSRVGVPITWGIVYPVVLLPDDADAWPEERRRFVLVHEMAHVKRLDALTQLAGQLALALFWFNPLVWIANRRMQLEREHACDDYVLRHGTPASHYAEELLAMVRSLGAPGQRTAQPAFAALAMARRSEFEGRMLSILDPVLDRHPLSKGRTIMSALAALLLVVPLAALHPYERVTGGDTALPESFKVSFHLPGETPPARPQASSPSVPSQPSSPSLPSAPFPVTSPTSPTTPTSAPGALEALNAGLARTADDLKRLAAQTKAAAGTDLTCDRVQFQDGSRTSVHSHDDDDPSSNAYRFLNVTGNRCSQAWIMGSMTFTDAEDDVATMSYGASALLRERTPDSDRELVVRPAVSGGVERLYRLNGANAPYDAAAQRWLASYLPGVLREGAINVKPRVARLRQQGGVDAVLRMIGTIRSSGAKRSHYAALVEGDRLSGDELDQVIRHAGRNISSSGDLRSLLTKVGPAARNNARTSSAFVEAFNAVASSGDKRAILQVYGKSTDRDMLVSVMKLTETVPSSGDKASLLKTLAPNYLERDDEALREAWFRALSTVPSSGDRRSVLTGSVMGFAAGNEKIAYQVARAAADVPSSGDRASVLLSLADAGALKSARVRDAYLRATENMSSGDASRVLRAAAVDRY